MGRSADAADAYTRQLRALWKAAGEPKLAAINRQAKAQRPPLGVPSSTWSDWANGRSVPQDARVARWLIEDYLRPLARRTNPGFVAPPASWWEQTRALARAQRNKGGRPPHEWQTAPGVERSSLIRVGLIPPQADCFQERKVAAVLDRAAGQDGTVVVCQVLEGMGGVGKTQLAAAYARRARDRVEILVWVMASSRPAVVDAYTDAAVKLGIANRDNPERATTAFLEWADTTDRPWLVILDDVHSPGDLRGLWPPDRPVGTTLVTTRRRDLAPPGLRPVSVEIGTYTLAEARSYLLARLGPLVDDQLDSLIEDLGYLPLALTQAAAFMRHQHIGCARYRVLFAERLLAHAVPEPEDLPDDHRKIIAATWDLSIDQANRARPVGLARPLLRFSSVLYANGIPAKVFASQAARNYLITCLRDTRTTTISPAMVEEALRTLHRFSLITHDPDALDREVRVHQLIQRAAREHVSQSDPDQGRLTALAHAAADALVEVWPDIERDQLSTILRANTTTLQETTGTALCSPDTGAHDVLSLAAGSLGGIGQVTAAVIVYTDLHSTCLHRLGADHPHTLAARNNLARWQGEAGDVVGAVAAFEKLLPKVARAIGPDHPNTLSARHNLVYWRGMAGDAVGAVAEFEELLVDRLRVSGPSHPDTLAARNNLARWRGDAGDAVGAVAALEELLPEVVRVLGIDHPNTLSARHNLVYWRGMAGDAVGAVAEFEELLVDRRRVLRGDHLNILVNRHDLACWRGEAGDVAAAVAALEELLPDVVRILGPHHPQTIAIRHNLAYWRGAAGDAAAAAAAFEELLPEVVRVLGPHHPQTMATYRNLVHWRERDRES